MKSAKLIFACFGTIRCAGDLGSSAAQHHSL